MDSGFDAISSQLSKDVVSILNSNVSFSSTSTSTEDDEQVLPTPEKLWKKAIEAFEQHRFEECRNVLDRFREMVKGDDESWLQIFICEHNRLLCEMKDAMAKRDWSTIGLMPNQFSNLIKQLEERGLSIASLETQIVLLLNLGVLHGLLGEVDDLLFVLECGLHKSQALLKLLTKHRRESLSQSQSLRLRSDEWSSSSDQIGPLVIEIVKALDVLRADQAVIIVELLWLICAGWLMTGSYDRAVLVLDRLSRSANAAVFSKAPAKLFKYWPPTMPSLPLSNHITFYLLSIFLAMRGKVAQALKAADDCLNVAKEFWPAVFLKAQLHSFQGEYEKALAGFQECAYLQRYRPVDSLNSRGCIFSHKKEYWVAVYEYSQALSISLQPELLMNVARQYRALKKLEQAHKMLEYALETIQRQAEKNVNMSLSTFVADYSPQTELRFSKMTSKDYAISTRVSLIDVLYELAHVSIEEGRVNYAAACYKQISQMLAKKTEAIPKLPVSPIRFFREYVSILIRAQYYEDALQVCEHLLDCDPNDVLTMIDIADICVCLNTNFGKAEQLLLRASDIIQVAEQAEQMKYFSFRSDQGPTAKRIKVSSSNQFNSFMFEKKTIQCQLHNSFLFDPVERKKVKMRVLNNLAMIYICFNKLPEALDTLEMAYKLGNRNENVVYNYCLLLSQCEKMDQAIEIWLSFREISLKLPHYDNLIQTKKQEVSKSIPVTESHVLGNVSNYHVVLMDIYMLQKRNANLQQKVHAEVLGKK